MVEKITYKEIRELTKTYKSILRKLSDGKQFGANSATDLKSCAVTLIDSDFFDDLVKSDFNGSEIDYSNGNLKLLISLIYKYKMSRSYSLSSSILIDNNKKHLDSLILRTLPANNPISWFFTSKKNKESAQEAYEELVRIKEGSFGTTAMNLINKMSILDSTYEIFICDDFKENTLNYRDNLLKAAPEIATYRSPVTIFKILRDSYEDEVAKENDIKKDFNLSKGELRKAVDYMLVSETLNLMRDIPIEELSRAKNGLKIKLLKDAGFKNMADIFTASIAELSSVHGISNDAAKTIKNIGDKYAKDIRKEQKIKLTADNKTKTATNVIYTAYAYLKRKEICNELKEFDKEYSLKMLNAINDVYSVGNGCVWPFLTQEKRAEIKNDYDYAKETIDHVYAPLIEKALEKRKELRKITTNDAWDAFCKDPIEIINTIEEAYPGALGKDDSEYGLPKGLARKIQDQGFFPDGLLCTLRRYQELGVKYILHQEKVLLGDEMGLGKTIQAIATMVSLKNTGATHFLVICPASVVTNWCREITKHSKLRVTKIHGQNKTFAFESWLTTGGVAVTNYESTSYLKFADYFKFSLLIVDEAHFVKNPNATRSQNVKDLCLHADRLLFMTGTALENNVDEMISLISFLNPSIANSAKRIAYMSSAPNFRKLVAPVYYRRKREDVLTELPDKIESEEWCPLNPKEELIYENAILSKKYNDARRVSWNVNNLNDSSKAIRLKEIIDEAETEGRKILVFSFFLETINKIYGFLHDKCLTPINGSVNVNRRQEILDEFEKAPAGTVLLAQITSGGTGLNIQSASVVVICEPQFKPSIENQAISRAYRMGQSRNVLVYRLLSENTVDEKLIGVLKGKQKIFDAFADKSVAAQQEIQIDEKTFGQIIKEEIDRINEKRGQQPTETQELKRDLQSSKPKQNKKTKKGYYVPNLEGDIHGKRPSLSNKEYYRQIMNLSYDELVKHLLKRYGPAKYDYYNNTRCTSKNSKVTRTKEGLFCHHIDEDKAIMLSSNDFAAKNPFKYQKADRLVYCNYLEHLLLHILIFEEPRKANTNKNEIQGIGGAVCYICRHLNDLYNGYKFTKEWMIDVNSAVINDYESYIVMLKRLWLDIKNKNISFLIKKEDLCVGWEGKIYQSVLRELD